MKHTLLASLLLFMFFAACKKECDSHKGVDDSFKPDYFEFGYGGGFIGNHKSFVIKQGQLYPEDTTHAVLSNAAYNMARTLIDHFPAYLTANPNQNFGCQSCADTYITGVRARINGVTYFWYMDNTTDQLPVEIRADEAEVVRITDQL